MKNKIITVTFLLFLFSILIINLIIPTEEISYSERRKLAQFPELSAQNILNAQFMKEFEKYTLDQFAFRDGFRNLKASFDLKIFNKLDNNNIYVIDDSIFKMEYPFKTHNVYKVAEHMNTVYDLYLKDMNVYYSIIPDKNYFVAEQSGYLSIDYSELEKIMTENIKNMIYIDILDSLTVDDYYRTDVHWRQERLDRVVATIAKAMHFTEDVEDTEYTLKTYYPFYGAYYGQSALRIDPDILIYKTNSTIENAIVYNYESSDAKNIISEIYNEQRLGMVDSYDIFLSGATPLMEIKNPNNENGRELIIFRDSFASSLAPLLLEEYSEITLVDLRYVNYKTLGDFIDFKDQDVLFIYNTLLINNGNILK